MLPGSPAPRLPGAGLHVGQSRQLGLISKQAYAEESVGRVARRQGFSGWETEKWSSSLTRTMTQ
jgi:hypothetical protein